MPSIRHLKSEQLMQFIEDRGYRSTSPRDAVIRAIADMDSHFTADMLHKKLPQVGRATVYRCLNLLVECGVVCRVLLENGSLHYQLSHRGHHHHLVCAQCGASQDLLGCDIDGILEEKAAQHMFQAESHWLEVYGLCQNCAPYVGDSKGVNQNKISEG